MPWILETLKPIQQAKFDLPQFLEGRKAFTTEEWLDLLIQTIGFNPEMISERNKYLLMARMIPFCERNYNLIELGPKGTGKSHIYSDFSPHGILLSGGEVSIPKLFVNNSTGRIGLVGYWDTVAFDEFAGKEKKPQKALVDIMKNYMANKSFSRGNETLGADASMAFEGNTSHNVPYMLRYCDLFDDLPAPYHDSAFLDRINFSIPGWEIDIIRGELFTSGYGFIIDYLAEALRNLRGLDYSQKYEPYFELSSDLSTRDKDGIRKTISGMLKILFPDESASKGDIEKIVKFAIEGRKRVKDQLMRIDSTFPQVHFLYADLENSKKFSVNTLEELQYPQYYYRYAVDSSPETENPEKDNISFKIEASSLPVQEFTDQLPSALEPEPEPLPAAAAGEATEIAADPFPYHHGDSVDFLEGQIGFSFEKYFGPYLRGAKEIELTGAYIRFPNQFRNLIELLQVIIRMKDPSDEVDIMLTTGVDYSEPERQKEFLDQVYEICKAQGINFDYKFDGNQHDRWIKTDTGWRINLGIGLDVFQGMGPYTPISFGNEMQELRSLKQFGISYHRYDMK